MRPVQSDIQTTGSISDQAVSLSIDEQSMGHIMSILTDLYSDPELAVIREYSSNAYDAQRENGYTGPIEVTTPTVFESYLKIRDFGVGLSVNDIIDTYSKYGASTKRDSDDFVGMLGLGCKSGLTYADQFTVASVHNGVKVTAVVMKDENGTGHIDIVDTKGTKEPSGTLITIPTKRHDGMLAKANEFFQYWAKGSVLLNGKPPKHFTDARHYKVSDTEYIINGSRGYGTTDIIVMGNVAYESDVDSTKSYSKQRVSFVPIGSVAFTPSRESLHFTKRTNSFLEQSRKDFAKAIQAKVDNDLAKAKTTDQALAVAADHWEFVESGTVLKWGGKEIPKVFTLAKVPDAHSFQVGGQWATKIHQVHPQEIAHKIVVLGFEGAAVSPTMRAKAKHYADLNNVPDNFVFTPSDVFTPWAKPKFVQYADIKAIVLPPNLVPQSARSRTAPPKGTYETVNDQGNIVQNPNITGDIVYVSPAALRFDRWENRETALKRIFGVYGKSHTIVLLGLNRHKKFERDYPNAKSIIVQWQEDCDAQTWNDNEKILLDLNDEHRNYYKQLGKLSTDIKDPRWLRVIEASVDKDAEAAVLKHRNRRNLMGLSVRGIYIDQQRPTNAKSPLTTEPLVRYNERRHECLTDAVTFINAKYEMRTP